MKNKKLFSIVIALILTASLCVVSYAGKYSSEIDNVQLNLSLMNAQCTGAPQQSANGAYRSVDMLEIIAKELDS